MHSPNKSYLYEQDFYATSETAAVNLLLDPQADTLWGPMYLLGVSLGRQVPNFTCLLFCIRRIFSYIFEKQQKSSKDACTCRCLHIQESLVVYLPQLPQAIL